MQTPLSVATLSNNARLVGLLVDRAANVNAQFYEEDRVRGGAGSGGSSGQFCAALHVASSHGPAYVDTLTQLLRSPTVDLSVVDSQGSLQTSPSAAFFHCSLIIRVECTLKG